MQSYTDDKKTFFRFMYPLTALFAIGVWLTGELGREVHIGSHVFGRYIGIDETETWSSLLGWAITVISLVLTVIVLYRFNRS